MVIDIKEQNTAISIGIAISGTSKVNLNLLEEKISK